MEQNGERGRGEGGTVGVQWVRGMIDAFFADKASLTTGGEVGQGSEEGRGETVSRPLEVEILLLVPVKEQRK